MSNVRNIQITNGGALALYSVLRDVKWYTELVDLMNAGALAKLLEKKLPAVRDLGKIPESEHAAWMDQYLNFKVGQSITNTVKLCLEAHAKQGAFMGTSHIMNLFKQFGVEFTDPTEELLAMNVDQSDPAG